MRKVRERIDIEALLERAYRVHRVEQATSARVLGFSPAGPSISTTAALAEVLALGTRVDTSFRAAALIGASSAACSVPDDILAVHDAVLALDDFFLEPQSGDVWDVATAAEAGLAIVNLDAERKPPGQRWRIQPARLDVDATAEDFARFGHPVERIVTSMMMILHARIGGRPTVAPVKEIGRKPIYKGRKKQAVDYEPVYETPLREVTRQRAEYAVWHAALGLLAAELCDLDTFEVVGPAAAAAPWKVGAADAA